jgi:hypothetical protein
MVAFKVLTWMALPNIHGFRSSATTVNVGKSHARRRMWNVQPVVSAFSRRGSATVKRIAVMGGMKAKVNARLKKIKWQSALGAVQCSHRSSNGACVHSDPVDVPATTHGIASCPKLPQAASTAFTGRQASTSAVLVDAIAIFPTLPHLPIDVSRKRPPSR